LALSDSKNLMDAWAHDGKAILFESDRAGRFEIFRQPLDSDTAQLLIQGEDDLRNAFLAPSGDWILYWVFPRGDSPPKSIRLMRMRASGGPSEQVLEAQNSATTGFDCPAHDGAVCVFGRREDKDYVFYELDPLSGLGKEVARTHEPVGSAWGISPDGDRIAIEVEGGLRLIDLRTRAERNLQVPGSFWSISWAADGKAVFAAIQNGDYTLVRIELNGKTHVLLNRGRNQWLGFALASPDGTHLAFSQQSWDTNSWLLENF
jgi:Tol biopolymer transport system component